MHTLHDETPFADDVLEIYEGVGGTFSYAFGETGLGKTATQTNTKKSEGVLVTVTDNVTRIRWLVCKRCSICTRRPGRTPWSFHNGKLLLSVVLRTLENI